MREEDFVLAARLDGESEWAIIVRYMIPGFASYIIVSLTGSLPGMILGETSLSFLGIGLIIRLLSGADVAGRRVL
jgi:peptide/nickel transport system permease protein